MPYSTRAREHLIFGRGILDDADERDGDHQSARLHEGAG
jgi:hypothetical protein